MWRRTDREKKRDLSAARGGRAEGNYTYICALAKEANAGTSRAAARTALHLETQAPALPLR